MKTPSFVVLAAGVAALTAVPVAGQCELERFEASDGLPADAFGSYIALSGNRAVVGAPNDDEGGQDVGAVFVYEKTGSTWVETAKLLASDGEGFDRFGSSVAIDADRIVVGAPQEDTGGFDSGAAYVFEYDGSAWVETLKLTAFDAFLGDFYGINVAVVGDRLVVGACQVVQFQTFGTGDGKVYVYTGSGASWPLEQQLTASDPDAGDRFGAGVAFDGTRILVGAENDDQGGLDSGAGYVFDLVGSVWTESQKLLTSDAGPGALAGVSVSIDDDRVLLGAPLHSNGGIKPGAAYLFEYDGSTWTEAAKLISSSPVDEDRGGLSVVVRGDLALVGAYSQTSATPGRVLSFTRSVAGVWSEGPEIQPAGAVNGDSFGYGVALDGARIVAGARSDDLDGSAYEFLWSPASATSRNAGANPASFSAVSPPTLGSTLGLNLDLAGTTGHSLGGVVAFASPLTFALSGGQFVLVNIADTGGELFGLPLLPGPTASWNLSIPTDVSFCGLSLSAQGIHIGGVQPFALSNALDFVVGA